jgi:hypothetical protein
MQEREQRRKKDELYKRARVLPGRILCKQCLGIIDGDLDRVGTVLIKLLRSAFCWHWVDRSERMFNSKASKRADAGRQQSAVSYG